jgi:serine/threonine protein kinase
MDKRTVSQSTTGSFEPILYAWKPGEMINNRYIVTKQLGDGTFGRVLEIQDRETNVLRAMKIVMPYNSYI